ncbi:MAG: hypothetical protein ACRDPD_24810, partial [Streptosporangiaceae bacterium]
MTALGARCDHGVQLPASDQFAEAADEPDGQPARDTGCHADQALRVASGATGADSITSLAGTAAPCPR